MYVLYRGFERKRPGCAFATKKIKYFHNLFYILFMKYFFISETVYLREIYNK